MAELRLLAESDWLPLAGAHRGRVEALTAAHQDRARDGRRHPVWDFLFTYYSLRPRQLRVWHPGYGTALTGPAARQYLNRAGYRALAGGVGVGPEYLRSRLDAVGFVAGLLRSTAARPARFGCFGMHEWAMVYRANGVRHSDVPLRLGQDGTDAVVESMPLRCSHFTRATQGDWEQPGCLHANMDLYKWCYKLGPLVESGLVLACLELAAEARALDMQASPYDLRDFGFDPVAVEEPVGRAEYVRRQGLVAERAAPLRAALLDRCERLLAHEHTGGPPRRAVGADSADG
jgi:hypothetical protein